MLDAVIISFAMLFIAGTVLLVINFIKLRKTKQELSEQKAEIHRQMSYQLQNEARVRELIEKNNHLIRIVSHDLKSPVNRIFALTQLIQEESGNLSENQKEYLGRTHQAIADMLSMIRNLLDTRWLDGDPIDLRPEKFNLTSALNNLIRNYQPLATRKKIQITANLPAQVIVSEDRHFLFRIIENILSNAVKFSQEGKNITVSLQENVTSLLITIQDEGPGFSEDDLKKLYQKYVPLTARPTGGESSTGLGLAIVKTLADKMGIVLTCESELGKGTTFSMALKKKEPMDALK